MHRLQIFHHDPDLDLKPGMLTLEFDVDDGNRSLLDTLIRLKSIDPSLSLRRSCREDIGGSDAMTTHGKNGLACLTNMRTLPGTVVLKPLPGLPALPVMRDLIVDMTQLFKQHHSIKRYLVNNAPPPERGRLQSPQERDELNGLYECILCACCTSARPSCWWNLGKYVGPAGLLQAYRFPRRQSGPGHPLATRQSPGPLIGYSVAGRY